MVSEEELEEGDLDLDWFDFQLKHDLILVGSPDSVSEQIERLETETGCPHLAFFLNIPLLSFQQVMHSLDLASSKVIPRLQLIIYPSPLTGEGDSHPLELRRLNVRQHS